MAEAKINSIINFIINFSPNICRQEVFPIRRASSTGCPMQPLRR